MSRVVPRCWVFRERGRLPFYLASRAFASATGRPLTTIRHKAREFATAAEADAAGAEVFAGLEAARWGDINLRLPFRPFRRGRRE